LVCRKSGSGDEYGLAKEILVFRSGRSWRLDVLSYYKCVINFADGICDASNVPVSRAAAFLAERNLMLTGISMVDSSCGSVAYIRRIIIRSLRGEIASRLRIP
jgi:hypothetical protein